MRAAHGIGVLTMSVAAFYCGTAIAGTMTATPIAIDMATAPNIITLPDITVTFGHDLTTSDTVSIKVAGAAVDITAGAPVDAVSCDLTGSPKPIEYGNVEWYRWNFWVTEDNGVPAGTTCTIHGLQIRKSSIQSVCQISSALAAYRGSTPPVGVDSGGPITVATVTDFCPPSPEGLVTIYPTSIKGGVDQGPQDGTFDTFMFNLSIDNNGWTSHATAAEFNLGGVPAGESVESATLKVLISSSDGVRSLAFAAYAGDGNVSLADFTAGSIVSRQAVSPMSLREIDIDVTDAIAAMIGDHAVFAGFNVREDVPCSNCYVMYFDLAAGFPVLEVAHAIVRSVGIDVRPGTVPNNINPGSNGKVPVAILSDAEFYAPSDIDVSSLRFGRKGIEFSLQKCNELPEDVNSDGLLDLVCHFDMQLAAFQAGDARGVLKGTTTGGLKIKGTDAVRIVP